MSIYRIRAEFGNESAGRSERLRFESQRQNEEERTVRSAGILIKAGVCALALALVLTLKLLGDAGAPVSASLAGEEQGIEELGKLKFVELPGMIEVFAAGRLPVGVEYISHRELNDGAVLCLNMAGEETVSVPTDCRVKEVMPFAGGLHSVSVFTKDDLEIIYGGLAAVNVEAGQGLCAGDTLGTATDGHTLTIEVRSSGRPQEPAAIFGISGGNKY